MGGELLGVTNDGTQGCYRTLVAGAGTQVVVTDEAIQVTTTGGGGGSGTVWHAVNGVPNSLLGTDGDFALDSLTGNVYQKFNGAWE